MTSGLKADGILGLAPTTQGTAIDMIYNRYNNTTPGNGINLKVFSMAIASGGLQSRFTFGGYDSLKYGRQGGSIEWHSIHGNKYWQINMSGVSIGNSNIITSTNQVIVDSGTSYLLMPSEDFMNFAAYF